MGDKGSAKKAPKMTKKEARAAKNAARNTKAGTEIQLISGFKVKS